MQSSKKHDLRKTKITKTPPFYRPEFEEAFRFIIESYEMKPAKYCIFLPCAITKPYSKSHSHIKFQELIDSVFERDKVQVVVFGSCGVVPRELETMYPFCHYKYMHGKMMDEKIRRDFLVLEKRRLTLFFEKINNKYEHMAAYCIGPFRTAMQNAADETGTKIVICPSDDLIAEMSDPSKRFPEGSLNMQEYLMDFRKELFWLKNS